MGGVYFCFDIKDEFLVEEKKMCGILFKKEVVLKFMKTNITSTHENALVIAQTSMQHFPLMKCMRSRYDLIADKYRHFSHNIYIYTLPLKLMAI